MKFEISTDDNKKCLQFLEVFIKEAEAVYKEEIPKAKSKVKKLQYISITPLRVDELLSDESPFMMAWEDAGKVYLQIAQYMPKMVKWLGKHRGMEKNLREFLRTQGIEDRKSVV
jgi:hypothetical protein